MEFSGFPAPADEARGDLPARSHRRVGRRLGVLDTPRSAVLVSWHGLGGLDDDRAVPGHGHRPRRLRRDPGLAAPADGGRAGALGHHRARARRSSSSPATARSSCSAWPPSSRSWPTRSPRWTTPWTACPRCCGRRRDRCSPPPCCGRSPTRSPRWPSGVAVGAPTSLVPHAAKSLLRAASTTLHRRPRQPAHQHPRGPDGGRAVRADRARPGRGRGHCCSWSASSSRGGSPAAPPLPLAAA